MAPTFRHADNLRVTRVSGQAMAQLGAGDTLGATRDRAMKAHRDRRTFHRIHRHAHRLHITAHRHRTAVEAVETTIAAAVVLVEEDTNRASINSIG